MILRNILISLFLFSTSLIGKQNKTICLNMIVKNESKVIERCLASVKPWIDYWVIVDTGSTDGTQEVIKNFMKDIPGELHQSHWVNFEHNRNEALNLARDKGDYILFIDADERLIFSDGNSERPALDKDFYVTWIVQESDIEFQRILLINTALNWRWEGVVHETIVCDEAKDFELLKNVYDYSNTLDGNRSTDPKKYHKDAQVLEEALKEDPTNSRYVFYLAQSYFNAKEYELSLKNYEKRAQMGDWDQEVFWSLFSIAKLQKILNKPEKRVVESLWRAFQYRPSRAEPLYELINYYMLIEKNYPLAYIISKYATTMKTPNDWVFVDKPIYEYGLLLQFADCAHFMGKYDEAYPVLKKLVKNPQLPKEHRSRIETNIKVIEKLLF